MVVKYRFRLYVFTLAMLCGFALLVYRLWWLQIEHHRDFVDKVPEAKRERARIPGVRGEIKDRNGIVLASNQASFEVRVNLREVVIAYREKLAEKNRGVPLADRLAEPVVQVDWLDGKITRQRQEPDIVAMFQELIEGRLAEMGLAAPFNKESLRTHYRTYTGVIPWVYRDNLTFQEFSRFAEHNLSLPGVTVADRGTRVYPYGAMACHLLGYVRLPDVKRVSAEERGNWNYYMPDDYGGAGVEKSFDEHLRGKPGVRVMQLNERGRIVGEHSYEPPRKGNDVFLTLDARIQYIAERALRDGNVGRGSVVVIKPDTGEVLAMASVPSYDPNRFIPKVDEKDWNALLADATVPLLNRSIQGYVPGSTYKVPIAMAGLLKGLQNRSYNCAGAVTYGKPMQCWIQRQSGGSHGSLALSDALMRSCNCFFYLYGNDAGIDNITKVGRMLALGQKTGIELEDEKGGNLPNPDWLRVHYPQEKWSAGFTANTSIGQGYVLASPLQMASVTAAVATGKAMVPHLLYQVRDGDAVVQEHKPVLRTDLRQHFKDSDLQLVRQGMWKVVNAPGGTASKARIKGVEVAGKTGTAQNWRRNENNVRVEDNHTLFLSFAPFVNPKFAVCILVQGGKSGGGCAAPVAQRVLEQALALENGYSPTLERLPEAKGNFNKIEAVTYADSPVPLVLAAAADDDGDTGTQPERESREEGPRLSSAPDVRKTADTAAPTPARPRRASPLFAPAPPPAQPPPPAKKKGGLFKRLFGD